MPATYRWLLTDAGLAKRASAEAGGAPIAPVTFAVGDGGGVDHPPEDLLNGLINEVWRGAVTRVYVSPTNETLVIIEMLIPPEVGPFDVREVAIIDDEDDILCVGNYPLTQKPDPATGGQKEIMLRGGFRVSNGGDVVIQMDTSFIMATQAFVEAYAAPIIHQHVNDASIGGPYTPAGTDNTPVGTVIQMPRLTPPAKYLKVNGVLLDRTVYAALWAEAQASGNLASDADWIAGRWGSYSTGNGATTFRIPDYRGMTMRGLDDGRGIDTGRVPGSYQADAIKLHAHNVGVWIFGGGQGIGKFLRVDAPNGYERTATVGDYGNNGETRVKGVPTSYFIKYI